MAEGGSGARGVKVVGGFARFLPSGRGREAEVP